jgi:MFS family permease
VPTAYAAVAAILVSVLALMSGNAMLNTLVPLAGRLSGFNPIAVGLLGSLYFAGMLAGTLACPAIIRRVGHIRAYAIFGAIAVIAAISLPLLVQPWWWFILRVLIGFALAGLFGVIDGWVQGKATNATRGRISALNQLVNYIAVAIGQQMVPLGDPLSFALFTLAGVLFALSIVPFALSNTPPPEAPSTATLLFRWTWRTAPVSVAVALAVGSANGAFWSLAPVYGLATGLDARAIASFLTATILGSAVAIWTIGRLSDRMDRRFVIAGLCAIAILAEGLLALIGKPPGWLLIAIGVVLGSAAMTQYAIALAHANDRAEGGQRVALALTLLFLYSVGAIVSPTLTAWLMEHLRPSALFGFMAGAHLLVMLFILIRLRQRPPSKPSQPAETAEARRVI